MDCPYLDRYRDKCTKKDNINNPLCRCCYKKNPLKCPIIKEKPHIYEYLKDDKIYESRNNLSIKVKAVQEM